MKALSQFIAVVLIITSVTLNVALSHTAPSLTVPKPRSEFDISHDYHLTLLKMALKEAANGRVIPKFNVYQNLMSQKRASAELLDGESIDVYWLGADASLDASLRAIQVPTTRGLIGYRQFIVNKASTKQFDKIQSIEDLQSLVACQGSHWPDTIIMREANLKVVTSPLYENLFKMLNAKRCDYFPRGLHDIKNELSSVSEQFPNLINYEPILMHYPFAVFFYTSKSNEALAQWIEQGMLSLAKQGKIESLMQRHPLTSHVYPLSEQKSTTYLSLDNLELSSKVDHYDPALWIQPKDFDIKVAISSKLSLGSSYELGSE
ncbi:MAG: hypothetical protein WA981_01385 [Glaciecola sp.]